MKEENKKYYIVPRWWAITATVGCAFGAINGLMLIFLC